MEFWTILWVTVIGGIYDGENSFMVYPSMDSCRAALSVLSDTLPYDHGMLCEETTAMSKSLRPKRRPGVSND